jgi:hypothetical protein
LKGISQLTIDFTAPGIPLELYATLSFAQSRPFIYEMTLTRQPTKKIPKDIQTSGPLTNSYMIFPSIQVLAFNVPY